MLEYTACFIAIPLPAKYVVQFQQMQQYLASQIENLTLAAANIPHLTLFYIGNCDQLTFDAVADIVRDYLYLLHDTTLVIHGVGTFGDPSPRVLYLKGNASPSVHTFAAAIRKEMESTLLLKDSLPFEPHLTLARIEHEAAQRIFTFKRKSLIKHLGDTIFAFPITEVVMYGKRATLEKQGHKAILELGLNN